MLNLHGISRESFDLIVDEEVSGRAVYEKKYVHPEKPGGASGVTIGIGYDCGYSSAATIRKDWAGKIPNAMVEALATQAAGRTGDAALVPCTRLRGLVSVPWDAAIDVFSNVSIPKYMAAARKGVPGYDSLPPDCKGAILSLVYNRGASFQLAGDRYSEMRGIRAAMSSGNLAAIPGLLRSMARLWTTKSVRGVALRREHEARLFERGLASVSSRMVATDSVPESDRDEIDETAGTVPFAAPVALPHPTPDDPGADDPVLLSVQNDLKAMNYNPGIPSGQWGGMTAGAIAGFINDRGRVAAAPTSIEEFRDIKALLLAEIAKAKSEKPPFTRPVTEARKSADAATVAAVAPEVVPVKRNFLAAAWASFLSFLYGVYTQVSSYISQAWDFFTDHKDDVPTDSGILQSVWGWVTGLPPIVWIIAVAALFGFIALNSRSSAKTITESVSTGARQ